MKNYSEGPKQMDLQLRQIQQLFDEEQHRICIQINDSTDPDDMLKGLAVIPNRLMFSLRCLVEELHRREFRVESLVKSGLYKHRDLWTFLLGNPEFRMCVNEFRKFKNSVSIGDEEYASFEGRPFSMRSCPF
jgi:hypothetical protein